MVGKRAHARAVIRRAITQDITLEDFYANWPERGDPLLDAIFEETEDTIEHTPGSWRKRGVDEQAFRGSVPYKILLVDEQLLGDEFGHVDSAKLLEIRRQLLKELDLRADPEALAMSARQFVARELERRP